jgi:hypothetical protein
MALVVVATAAGGVIHGGPFDRTAPAAAQPVAAGTPGVTRYFGKGAYQGIRAAVAATPRACDLSDDLLTALVMAPIFKEVSMAETPDAAPSPMTLSRWDEWTGVVSGSSNLNANYGLYPFDKPHGTAYPRAYWTPGIGIFQYDVAGVGAPFTAAEMMDVDFIARDVAAGMAERYCAAGGSAFDRRAAAWQPWSGLGGVAKSEALLQEMVGLGRPAFSTIGLVEGIDNTGGMLARTCRLDGVETACHHIDPARAQGADWWATDDPDGGAVAAGEAPLTAPFYVLERGGYEERHWLAQDTGYPIDISARRKLGYNARPVDAQPGSGLQWFATSALCDTARPETGCEAPAPEAPAPEEAAATAPGASGAHQVAEEHPGDEEAAGAADAHARRGAVQLWSELVATASPPAEREPEAAAAAGAQSGLLKPLGFTRRLARTAPASP